MVLDGEGRDVQAPQPFEGPIVEVLVGGGHLAEITGHPPGQEFGTGQAGCDRRLAIGQGPQIDRKAMVLGCDLHPPVRQAPYRVVAAVMAERKLEGGRAQRQAEDLVAQADSEHRCPAQNTAHRGDLIGQRVGVPGTVGEEYAVGTPLEYVVRTACGR